MIYIISLENTFIHIKYIKASGRPPPCHTTLVRGRRGGGGGGGDFTNTLEHLWDLQARVPERGYYLQPTKIILVVAPGNVARAEEFFWGWGIKVVMGHRYLGGYIGDREAEGRWLA